MEPLKKNKQPGKKKSAKAFDNRVYEILNLINGVLDLGIGSAKIRRGARATGAWRLLFRLR